MRLRDENKRKLIVQTAVKLFSEQPFNKVRLDDVAEAAGVGKGTVYIYFKNKEELYYSLVYEGLAESVERFRSRLAQPGLSFRDKIHAAAEELVDYGIRYPQFFEILRTVGIPDAGSSWDAKRTEYCDLVVEVIRQGNLAGEFDDPRPEWTANYLSASVRATMLYVGGIADGKEFANHLVRVIVDGIAKKQAK
jgi:AcrR family transcriptional regulator